MTNWTSIPKNFQQELTEEYRQKRNWDIEHDKTPPTFEDWLESKGIKKLIENKLKN